MTRHTDREKVEELRRKGKTYSQINELLHIPKSTISNWLSDYYLSHDKVILLERNIVTRKYAAVEKIRAAKKAKHDFVIANQISNESIRLLPLNAKEKYIAGLMLYWGEGRKGWNSVVSLANTNPAMILWFKDWLITQCDVPVDRLRVGLHLYRDMNEDELVSYWSSFLHIPRKQFIKPYVKKSFSDIIEHAGYGQGTCTLYVYDVKLKRKIMAGIKAIETSVVV